MSSKFILDTDKMHEDFFSDSRLITISSSLPCYRFCWMLNTLLNFDLKRMPEQDIFIKVNAEEMYFYSIYKYEVPNSSDCYSVYQLKNNKRPLLADLKNLDYLIMLKGPAAVEKTNEYLTLLRTIKEIQLAQVVLPHQVKNIDYLLL
ncbi:MAG TPA: IPExxxVDY family protein [Flavipsychrobacter sp.]|nr:IPExxxVDY family protein [Flavipsychrobacter sp.]